MKSLDELATKLDHANSKLEQSDAKLEKRIDVRTLPGDDIAQHIISQPGSYYLSGNIIGGEKTAVGVPAPATANSGTSTLNEANGGSHPWANFAY